MSFTIYKITCPEGRSYIGCTSKTAAERWRSHQADHREWPGHRRALLADAIGRFGKAAFKVTTLAVVEGADDAAAFETLMIERHRTAHPHGYNFMKTSHYVTHRWPQLATAA